MKYVVSRAVHAQAANSSPRGRVLRFFFAIAVLISISDATIAVAGQPFIRPQDVGVLVGTAPNLPTDDLARALGPIADEAQILALGESVHGARAFLEIEHRVVRYLVESKGYRLVVVEGGVLRTEPITQWLDACAKSQEDRPFPLAALPMPYAETVSLYEFLCRFNHQNPTSTVQVFGMDVADRPWEHQNRIAALAAATVGSPRTEVLIQKAHDNCAQHAEKDWAAYERAQKARATIAAAAFDACLSSLNKLEALTFARLRQIQSDKHTLYQLLRSIQTARGWQHFNNGIRDWGRALNERDRAMALNVLATWREFDAPKTIVLGHTLHTALMRGQADWAGRGGAFRSALYYVRTALPKVAVRSLALTGYELSGLRGEYLKPEAANSLDRQLHHLGINVAFVNLRRFRADRSEWWIQYDNAPERPNGLKVRLSEQFDGYVFVNSSAEGTRLSIFSNPWMW